MGKNKGEKFGVEGEKFGVEVRNSAWRVRNSAWRVLSLHPLWRTLRIVCNYRSIDMKGEKFGVVWVISSLSQVYINIIQINQYLICFIDPEDRLE